MTFKRKYQAKLNTWIRIRIPNTDPDPVTQQIRIRIHNPAGAVAGFVRTWYIQSMNQIA